jgi:hypothetical protein
MRGVLGTMTEELAREVAKIGVRLLDEAYMMWFAAESECEQALRVWSTGSSRGGAEVYWTYRAALDREEAAARDLQKLHQLTRSCHEGLTPPEDGVVVPDNRQPPQFQ